MTSPSQKQTLSTSPLNDDRARAWRQASHPLLALPVLLGGLISLAIRRLRHHPGLSMLALLGVVLAVGLVTSASFFAQAVDQVILTRELEEYTRVTKRPPFSTRVFSFSSPGYPLTVAIAEEQGQNVANTIAAEVGLPVREIGIQLDSNIMSMFPPPDSLQYDPSRALQDVHLIYIANVGEHVEVTSGAAYEEAPSSDVLQVWVHTSLAERIGVRPGEQFQLQVTRDSERLPVQIAGLWQAADPDAAFWYSNPDTSLRNKLLVGRADYMSRVEPVLPFRGRSVSWHIILDDSSVVPSEAREYVEGFGRSQDVINRYLPDAQLFAPSLSLEKFVARQTTLTTLLLGFNLPAFGFLVYFLVLTSVVIAYWQQRETAVLVSRGMRISSVLNFVLVEEIIIFIVGFPLGLALGAGLAQLMGQSVSFLDFMPREPLPVSWRGINLPLTFITLLIVLVARLWPAAMAARKSVVDQERDLARPQSGPFWYRNYLDFLLVLPTGYAYYQLRNRGSLAQLVESAPEDLYRDPLLVLLPALFVLTGALLTMRLFPLTMRILDFFANLTPWLVPHLALRTLGRQSHNYINPLLLVIVSLALGVYTQSMAGSLDQWLVDRKYYEVGADLRFEPYSEVEVLSTVPGQSIGAPWIPPVDEYRAVPGVATATRVGDYLAEVNLGGAQNERVVGRFLAVDRVDLASVAWFREDFAGEALGGLMNRLALFPDGILVSHEFLETNNLLIGDQLNILVVPDFGAGVTSPFTIVGTYTHFPTVYDDEVVLIGNLEHIFSFYGLAMPHSIWVELEPGVDSETVLANIADSTKVDTIHEISALDLIAEEQSQMERIGVFGTLSISFMAAAVMAAMGLLTYSYASLQDRLFRFAMLHAMGLRRMQIIGQVLLEYAVLTAYGAVAGTLIGAWTSMLFVPLFQVTGEGSTLPPLLPIIDQEQIILLGGSFALVMITLQMLIIAVALYRRLFSALRLGHQA